MRCRMHACMHGMAFLGNRFFLFRFFGSGCCFISILGNQIENRTENRKKEKTGLVLRLVWIRCSRAQVSLGSVSHLSVFSFFCFSRCERDFLSFFLSFGFEKKKTEKKRIGLNFSFIPTTLSTIGEVLTARPSSTLSFYTDCVCYPDSEFYRRTAQS